MTLPNKKKEKGSNDRDAQKILFCLSNIYITETIFKMLNPTKMTFGKIEYLYGFRNFSLSVFNNHRSKFIILILKKMQA